MHLWLMMTIKWYQLKSDTHYFWIATILSKSGYPRRVFPLLLGISRPAFLKNRLLYWATRLISSTFPASSIINSSQMASLAAGQAAAGRDCGRGIFKVQIGTE